MILNDLCEEKESTAIYKIYFIIKTTLKLNSKGIDTYSKSKFI